MAAEMSSSMEEKSEIEVDNIVPCDDIGVELSHKLSPVF